MISEFAGLIVLTGKHGPLPILGLLQVPILVICQNVLILIYIH